ncbi:hypothetical protein HG530_002863 [Fusarium avenaceum]|nr:hypothetical protein HG530_002863 [Fusarium avenaceum]
MVGEFFLSFLGLSLTLLESRGLIIIRVILVHLLKLEVAGDIVGLLGVGFFNTLLDGAGPQVLGDEDSEVVGGREDLILVLVVVIVIHVIIVILLRLALPACLLLLLLELAALLRLLGGDLAATETEEAEEADAAHASLLHEAEELLGGLGLTGLLAGLLLVVDLLGEAEHAVGQILALLPLDVDGLGDEAGPAVLVEAPEELLLEHLVLEPFVLLELPLEGDGAGVAVGELEALNGQASEGVEEELGVAGLDVLVNLGRGLLEDEGPELGDVGDDLLALDVEVLGELVLLTDCATVSDCFET